MTDRSQSLSVDSRCVKLAWAGQMGRSDFPLLAGFAPKVALAMSDGADAPQPDHAGRARSIVDRVGVIRPVDDRGNSGQAPINAERCAALAEAS
jgi:hypothetical protein